MVKGTKKTKRQKQYNSLLHLLLSAPLSVVVYRGSYGIYIWHSQIAHEKNRIENLGRFWILRERLGITSTPLSQTIELLGMGTLITWSFWLKKSRCSKMFFFKPQHFGYKEHFIQVLRGLIVKKTFYYYCSSHENGTISIS